MEDLISKLNHYLFSSSTSSPSSSREKEMKKVEIKGRELVDSLAESKRSEEIDGVSKEKFYLTTAINYTNGLPHLGHAYEAITADTIVRYHRTYGRDCFFLTGTDEHGQKVEQSAQAHNKSPQELADFYADHFKKLDADLAISYDNFIRTTDGYHKRHCEKLWNRVKGAGDIYLKPYVGWYDVHSERYVTEFEASKTDFKDEYGRPYERKSEKSYFFKMSKYQGQLLEHLEQNPNFIQPDSRKHEILSFLKEPLQDLCVSRTVCQWGVKVPDQNFAEDPENHVMYVWFDALTNYLSGIGYFLDESEIGKFSLEKLSGKSSFWPVNVHLIGKDIIRFHCVYWPCMLLSANVPLPKAVFAHGFVLDKDSLKMSKSLGNVVDPQTMIARYGVDCFRWFLCTQTTFGADLSFNEEAMVANYNSLLVAGFGNLVHRTTNLCRTLCASKVPKPCEKSTIPKPFNVKELKDTFEKAFNAGSNKYEMHVAGECLVQAINSTNKFLQDSAPWSKECTESDKLEIVRLVLEAVYVLGHFLYPFCPVRIGEVFQKLGVKMTSIVKLNDEFTNLPVNDSCDVQVGEVLYPVLEVFNADKIDDVPEKASQNKVSDKGKVKSQKEEPSDKSNGSETSFYSVELRVGKIVEVWEHPSADNLFCEKIDLGAENGGIREIASGLRKHYSLKDLDQRSVIVVCNLKPANLKGFKSNGMVLCACTEGESEGDEIVEFCEPPAGSAIGDRIYLEGSDEKEISPPLSANVVTKKKLFQKVAEKLSTNDMCEAIFDGRRLSTKSGVCKARTLKHAKLR